MGKRIRKSKKIFLIYIFLLLLSVICIYFGNYYSKEIVKNKNFVSKMSDKATKLDKEIQEKENVISEINNKISYYKDIDQTIIDTKNNYFKELKQLEDDILLGKSKRKIAYLTFDDT